MIPAHSIEIPNVPARQFAGMDAQPLVPWTPVRLMRAAFQWVAAAGRTKAVQSV